MVKAEMMSGSGSGKVVCVTGASGFIASWLVKLLLQRGYTVHGTVMDPTNPKETIHLHALDGAIERLHLYKANLLEEGSFDAAIKGCEGVFHTASPCFHETLNPQMDLIDPTMKGTLNVLASCKKFSVKRVVVTSSMAAVSQNCRPKTPDVVVDETWFSDLDYCQERKLWYMVAKTMAEDALWKFSRENGVEIVTIHPSVTIGPLLQPILNESASFLLKLLNGASSVFPYGTCGWVHVQDVAMAHILAFEVSSAAGRYCLAERVAHYAQIVDIIHGLYPSFKLADKCADNKSFIPMYQVSKEKAKSLGIDFIPLERGIMEMIQSLKEKGFFSA